jgi:protein-L-isoaspartate(D-aspartate) O-methyltransferase
MNLKSFTKILACVFAALLISCCTEQTQPSPTPTSLPSSTVQPEADLDDEQFTQAHQQLVEHAVTIQNLQDKDVIRAFSAVLRHQFVPPEYLDMAYEDHPLPIGYGQTISQPSLVAHMTEILELKPGQKVLEIGTGSGYQAAILAELGFVEVYTIEIVPELAENASTLLRGLGYSNVTVKQADGYYGWEEFAPFDAIIVTAAPDHLPAPLVEQLAENGRLVIPIGPPGWYQTLWKFIKQDNKLIGYNMGGVGFVPFTGEGVQSDAQDQTP